MLFIDINTLDIIETEDKMFECSVCGEYHTFDSFKNENEEHITRTNCRKCYESPCSSYEETKEKVKNIKKSLEYRTKLKLLKEYSSLLESSISVEDMIEYLSKLPKTSRLVMTQSGYYANGRIGTIFAPELINIFNNKEYYSIGNSTQDY